MAYLTKSRFKEALDCPDRLFYYGKRDQFADHRLEDDFLQELAKSGIQVGELAKCYFPEGVEVSEVGNTEALARSKKLLEADNITLFEAALGSENLLVRVDILRKTGNTIDIIEVKSKSIFDEEELYTKKGTITSDWAPYVYDVAFQVYVARKALQGMTIRGYLMLIDKGSICSVDGLYQKFRLQKVGSRYKTVVDVHVPVGDPILKQIDLTDTVLKICGGSEQVDGQTYSFEEYVRILEESTRTNRQIGVKTGRHCKHCSYRASEEDKGKGLLSGFEACWNSKHGFREAEFKAPSVFDIWNLHYSKLDSFLSSQRYFLTQLTEQDFEPKGKQGSTGRVLSSSQRQWIQVQKALDPSKGPYVDVPGLTALFTKLKYPLHFIDFEVSMNAIPFVKGYRPYHRFAFQYSHHVLDTNGHVRHAGQWMEERRGLNPNIEFVRRLRDELLSDDGTILIYSKYENAILLHLHDVVNSSSEPDKTQLLEFIKSVTWSDDERGEWRGSRAMLDMRDWVRARMARVLSAANTRAMRRLKPIVARLVRIKLADVN